MMRQRNDGNSEVHTETGGHIKSLIFKMGRLYFYMLKVNGQRREKKDTRRKGTDGG